MSFAENLTEIHEKIAASCARASRKPEGVKLLAVSKLQSAESVEIAYRGGLRDFGENYVQELLGKKERLKHLLDIRWHLIGPLQSNKAKSVVANIACFHALDSPKLALELEKRLLDQPPKAPLPVFLQVNIDNEASKSGIATGLLTDFALKVVELKTLRFQGLMCVPRPRPQLEEVRKSFQRMRELRDGLSERLKMPLELDMGMSEDFEVAIEEGADWIRVGRKLFGERSVQRKPE